MINLTNVSKIFATGASGLTDVSLDFSKGEFVFLIGHTGSGKTTLLRLLIAETRPTKGTITIANWDISKLPKNKIPLLRKKVGVIFQDLKLLMDRTILENVLLPLEITGVNLEEAKKRAEELLEKVGILEHKDKFPIQLSGGELQRAAIARALTLNPDVILADEPTGNLDNKTAMAIVDLLSSINAAGTTIIMATHNIDILEKYKNHRIVELQKGIVVRNQVPAPTVKKEENKNEIPVGEPEHHKKIEKKVTKAEAGGHPESVRQAQDEGSHKDKPENDEAHKAPEKGGKNHGKTH